MNSDIPFMHLQYACAVPATTCLSLKDIGDDFEDAKEDDKEFFKSFVHGTDWLFD